jgi:Helix-turn-helix domain of resolvase
LKEVDNHMEKITRKCGRRPKLSAAQVEQIRTRYLAGARATDLATEFSVSGATIGRVLAGTYQPRE